MKTITTAELVEIKENSLVSSYAVFTVFLCGRVKTVASSSNLCSDLIFIYNFSSKRKFF